MAGLIGARVAMRLNFLSTDCAAYCMFLLIAAD